MAESLDLCDAILGNSPCLVEHCLKEENADPNSLPKLLLIDDVPKDKDGKVEDTERILAETSDYVCSPIHVAIVNAYHHGRMDGIALKQRAGALRILDLLLEAGADVSTLCNQVLFCNIGDLNISSPGAPLDPISLTLSLKKLKTSSIHADERVDMMDEVLHRLVNARKALKTPRTPMATVPQLLVNSYRNLCLSDIYSDIFIRCKDGIELPAHRNILTASSSVLKAACSRETTGGITIHRSSHIMKAVLQFIYSGTLDECILESETATLLSISSELQLEALQQSCAKKCGERLTIQNVRVMLDIGERHKAKWIKKECLDFLQRQPIPVVLRHPKIIALATENPKLWEEIIMVVGGSGSDGGGSGVDEQAAQLKTTMSADTEGEFGISAEAPSGHLI